jgi:hypothetical protein
VLREIPPPAGENAGGDDAQRDGESIDSSCSTS